MRWRTWVSVLALAVGVACSAANVPTPPATLIGDQSFAVGSAAWNALDFPSGTYVAFSLSAELSCTDAISEALQANVFIPSTSLAPGSYALSEVGYNGNDASSADAGGFLQILNYCNAEGCTLEGTAAAGTLQINSISAASELTGTIQADLVTSNFQDAGTLQGVFEAQPCPSLCPAVCTMAAQCPSIDCLCSDGLTRQPVQVCQLGAPTIGVGCCANVCPTPVHAASGTACSSDCDCNSGTCDATTSTCD